MSIICDHDGRGKVVKGTELQQLGSLRGLESWETSHSGMELGYWWSCFRCRRVGLPFLIHRLVFQLRQWSLVCRTQASLTDDAACLADPFTGPGSGNGFRFVAFSRRRSSARQWQGASFGSGATSRFSRARAFDASGRVHYPNGNVIASSSAQSPRAHQYFFSILMNKHEEAAKSDHCPLVRFYDTVQSYSDFTAKIELRVYY